MIQIDMPLPDRCFNCPCSYFIQTGEHQNELMCEVKEYTGQSIEQTIVHMNKRPDDCPMIETDECVQPTWQQGKAYCGYCGKRISLKVKPKYCYKCGKRVDWN